MELTEKLILNKTIYLLEISGELDLYTAPDFRQRVIQRINKHSNKILFDLKELSYIDSSGVGALIRILQELKKTGGDHQVINLQAGPRKVLELSNIISLIKESRNKQTAAKELGE